MENDLKLIKKKLLINENLLKPKREYLLVIR